MTINTVIKKKKESLIKQAKKHGLWENFGQKEVLQLEDKFPNEREKILQFDNWCMNFTNKDIPK